MLMYLRAGMLEDIFGRKERRVKFVTSLLKESSTYCLERVEYPSPLKTPYDENNRAYAFHYIPKQGRRMLAVVKLHGLGVRTIRSEQFFYRILLRSGFDAVLFVLPYHLERTPKGTRSGTYFFSLERERSFNAFRQAVLDLRCLADYLTGRGLSLGICGTSLGAILLNTLMGVDGRYEIGVSVSGGGNINRIVWEGLMGRFVKSFLKSRGVKEDHYLDMLEEFRSFLAEIRNRGEIPRPKWEWWLLDPLTFAHLNRPRRVLLFNGLFDLIVPRSCAQELSSALGGVEICWLPASHFSIGLFAPLIVRRSLRFLAKYGAKERI